MEEAEKVKNRLEPFGYSCKITEDTDVVFIKCSPNVEVLERDKINRIEVLFPKRENLVNIEFSFPPGYRMLPKEEIEPIIRHWFAGDIHSYEAHLVGVEFRDRARESASAIAVEIIRERRRW